MRQARTLVLTVALLGLTLLYAGPASAGPGVVREATYHRLERVHELLGQGQHAQALERLKEIRVSGASAYEKAIVLQTYGYAYAGQEQYAKAIEAFEQSLALGTLPASATQSVLYALAQLQVASGRYREAVASLERWFSTEKKPSPEAYALAGWAYGKLERYDEAVGKLKKAIGAAGEPREAWYRQLLAIYYEAERYRAAAELLEEMIRRFPERKDYWLELSAAYQKLKQDETSLAVLELAYRKGLLSTEGEILHLVNYYLYLGAPYKAGELLARALEAGSVAATPKHWGLLSDAWLRARELGRALAALGRALELAPDAQLQLKRAQIAAEMEDWPTVLRAVDAALASGGLGSPGPAQLLRGIAHHHLGQREEAVAAFERAKASEGTREQAEQWLSYLSQEIAALGNSTPAGTYAGPERSN